MSALISDFDAPLPGPLYWDASFLVHAVYPAGRYHRECYAFLERLGSAGDTLSYVSTLALDEMVFTLIRLKVVENLVSNRVTHHIAEFDELSDFGINKKGGLIYIVGRIGDKTGLFELEILDD